MNLHFLIIDPQNDFADPMGNLFIPGADKDMIRLSAMIQRHLPKISRIHVTLDTHRWIHIAHPIFWKDAQNNPPEPFTIITEEDLLTGRWKTTHPDYQERAMTYVKTLKAQGRYNLTIWPPHCLIGHPGNNVVAPLAEVLTLWENTFALVDYIIKGSNMWTEHYSAVKADVTVPEDPSTFLNQKLIDDLKTADIIAVSGEALSHCVANTLYDIAQVMEDMSKIVLIGDTCSSVPGFESWSEKFLEEMRGQGMKIMNSTEYLLE